MPLTELAVRNAKPADRLVKFSDGGGLQLWVFPDGAKRWRLAYRAGRSQKLLAIGVYPEVGLKDAREARAGSQENPGRRRRSDGRQEARKGGTGHCICKYI